MSDLHIIHHHIGCAFEAIVLLQYPSVILFPMMTMAGGDVQCSECMHMVQVQVLL